MVKQVRILGIIPARGGSKRLPGKNKLKLGGKELIRYAIEAALNSKLLDQIVVTSDDPDILEISGDYGTVRALKRPEEISGDHALAITFVWHALESVQEEFDYIVIVQPTSPFTISEDIDATIDLVLNHGSSSGASIVKVDHALHPSKFKIMKGPYLRGYYENETGTAAHQMDEVYVRNGSVYVSSTKAIREGRILTEDCVGYVMPRIRSLDINDEMDFMVAKYLIGCT